MSVIVRAIDVGFGNTKFVTASADGRIQCSHFPSLAFITSDERRTDGIGGRRRTVSVPVNGLYYEVGPEVELAADRYRGREFHSDYIETEEYAALMAGALSYMKVDEIDLLVLGLPVSQYLGKRGALEKAMTRTFATGRKSKVKVKRVLVAPQPQGALLDYAARVQPAAAKGTSLVMDAGFRTFDWLVTRNMKVVSKMSGSANRGVVAILMAIAERIGAELGEEFLHLEAIDEALRATKTLRVYEKTFDLRAFASHAEKIADQAVSALIQRMDWTYDVQHIVLVGGGAPFYRKAINRHFKAHTIHEVPDPLYANVRGFQLLGEQHTKERPDLYFDAARASASAQPESLA